MDARLARICSDAGCNRAPEPRSRRVSEGGGLDTVPWRGQCGATRDDHCDGDQDEGQNTVHLSSSNRYQQCETTRNPSSCSKSMANQGVVAKWTPPVCRRGTCSWGNQAPNSPSRLRIWLAAYALRAMP